MLLCYQLKQFFCRKVLQIVVFKIVCQVWLFLFQFCDKLTIEKESLCLIYLQQPKDNDCLKAMLWDFSIPIQPSMLLNFFFQSPKFFTILCFKRLQNPICVFRVTLDNLTDLLFCKSFGQHFQNASRLLLFGCGSIIQTIQISQPFFYYSTGDYSDTKSANCCYYFNMFFDLCQHFSSIFSSFI